MQEERVQVLKRYFVPLEIEQDMLPVVLATKVRW